LDVGRPQLNAISPRRRFEDGFVNY
jgi:hypothetical protein